MGAYAPPMPTGVTAVIVNWNGASHLGSCLESVAAQSHENLQIVVVDNGSVDDSRSIADTYDVKWIQLHENVGLAPAMNIGADHATHPLLLFLNNDMDLEPEFVHEMVACHERHENIGAVDAIQRDWTTGEVVHAATTLRRAWSGELPGWTFPITQSEADCVTLFPSGANTLISAATFEELGRWDGRFFAGWEDVDLGFRLHLSGRDVVLATRAVSRHRVSASSTHPEGHLIRAEAAMHGRLLFAFKHAPPIVVGLAVARFVAASCVALLRRDEAAIAARRRVVGRLRQEVPDSLRWRRQTYPASATTPSQHWRLLRSIVGR